MLSPTYFLDDMTPYELAIYMEHLEYIDRTSWEQCRILLWGALAPNSKKNIELGKLMKFKWEEGKKGITDDEILKLTELSKQYECKFNS